jgi:thymidylate kinase
MDIILEFAGMPKSGKTTILEIVRHELRRREGRIIDFHGGGRYAPIDKDFLPELNTYLALEAVRFILELKTQVSPHDRIGLMDRGIFDRLIFTEALKMRGAISETEAEATSNFLIMRRLCTSVDFVFVFQTTPELSIQREAQGKLSPRRGRIMNADALVALRAAIDRTTEKYQSKFSNVSLVDTAMLNGRVTETAQMIVSKLDGALFKESHK